MMLAGQRTQLLIQHRGKNTLHDSMELCQGRSTMHPIVLFLRLFLNGFCRFCLLYQRWPRTQMQPKGIPCVQ
jgi:hypothetical protein